MIHILVFSLTAFYLISFTVSLSHMIFGPMVQLSNGFPLEALYFACR